MRTTRIIGLGALLVLGLCLVGTRPLQAQKPSAQNATAQQAAAKKKAEAAKKRAQAAKRRRAQMRRRGGRPGPFGPAFDSKLFDTTPTFEAVQPKDASELVYLIDYKIDARLQEAGIPPSPQCEDAEFIRRAYLDLVGVIPPAGKVAAFLDSRDSQKRAKLVDELLASAGYAAHQADIWQDLLVERTSQTARINFNPLKDWLQKRFAENQPWNEQVADLLTATGPQDENGAVTYYLANLRVDQVTDSVCKVFLGVQLQCAQCHDHPFNDWKQEEYWGMAAFFMKVQQKNNRNNQLKNGNTPEVVELPRMFKRKRNLPESAMFVSAKFLQGEEPSLAMRAPYRPVLADWLTSGDNPFFAQAMVNRTWAQFFGRGFVNPVDDMSELNPASHPELLAELTQAFQQDFDLKQLIRAICNSQAYQRTSKPLPGNAKDQELFSHMAIKVMTPQQLYDSLRAVMGNPPALAGKARKQRGRFSPRDRFVAAFSVSEEADPTKYEIGIPQALQLMNQPLLANTQRYLGRLIKPDLAPGRAIEHLYLATLGRRPKPEEYRQVAAYYKATGNPRDTYADLLWVLMNTSEFTLNH